MLWNSRTKLPNVYEKMPNQTLYKFRSWSNPNHKRSLLNREIFFASPALFNDPFDCFINYRYDLLTPEEKFEKYFDLIREEKPFLNYEEIKRQAKNWLKEGLLEKDQLFENNKTIIREMVNENVGILSLTKTNEPILLWSHYSDQHRGFCIGYDKDVLIADLMTKYNRPKKIFYESDVAYSETYPIIIPRKGITSAEYVRIPILTKAKFWDYEQEYRIFILGGTNEVTTLPPEAIEEIALGCKISDKDKIEIGEYVIKNLPHAELFSSKMHHELYELVFEKIN